MKFLFVHSWQGFCLAEWYLREAFSNHCGVDVEFRSADIPPGGIPANDILQRIIFSWEPDIIGFSCHYWSLQSFLADSKWIKAVFPETIIVLGGPQVNSVAAASSILENNSSVDYIIRGPGEDSLCMLLDSLNQKKILNPVPGLSFRDKGKILHSGKSHGKISRNLIFHRGNQALDDQILKYDEVSYETTRGCYSGCIYCYYPLDKFQVYDDVMVMAELSYICSLGTRNLRFCDTHFGGTAERAKKLLRHLKKVNRGTIIRIYPDPAHIDSEYLQLVSEAGAQITSIGIQTTNPVALKLIRRTPAAVSGRQIIQILDKFPDVPADLIAGLPGDSAEGLEKSFMDILEMGFTSVNIFRLMLFPGTELTEHLDEYFKPDKLIISDTGQVTCTPGFPLTEQKRISALIFALEIICWTLRTRTMKMTSSERIKKFRRLSSSIDSGHLASLYQAIQQGFTQEKPELTERIRKTVLKTFNEYSI